jgi:hypothetical protein
MKKILFVCSHLYSGSSSLYDSLNNHPKIQGYDLATSSPYSGPMNLLALTNQNHKLNNRSAIYMDELLYNHHLSTNIAYKECSFIYVVREPTFVLNSLIGNNKMKPSFAVRHYTYRLRRLCEMAKRTPGAVLLTWDDLLENRGISLIEDYLNLKQFICYDSLSLSPYRITHSTDFVGLQVRSKVDDAYQRYLYYLKNQNLRYWR